MEFVRSSRTSRETALEGCPGWANILPAQDKNSQVSAGYPARTWDTRYPAVEREVTLGLRQDNLCWLLRNAGYPVEIKKCPCLQREDIEAASLGSEVQSVYKQLDGELNYFPIRVGHWDLRVGAVAIELDEEQHFNRYRLQALQSSVYSTLSSFPRCAYLSYCERQEKECLRKASRGGYWSNASCIRQFGRESSKGDLTPPGSPRWKQRAFYDFLKDLAPIICDTPLARVSIWDDVSVNGVNVLVKEVLRSRSSSAVPGLVALMEARAGVSLLRSG